MGQYGRAAVKAVEAVKLVKNPQKAPQKAWKDAIGEQTDSESSQKKGCPRNAFLGLCEAGKIKGISKGSYDAKPVNKDYAIKAVEILREEPKLSANKTALWKKVMNKCNKSISRQGQMDVVTALWKEKLIKGNQ